MKTHSEYLLAANKARNEAIDNIQNLYPIAALIQEEFHDIEVELSSSFEHIFVSVKSGIHSFYTGLEYLEFITDIDGDVISSYDYADYRAFQFKNVVLFLYPNVNKGDL